VEILEPKGFGRCRMRPLADASAASLHPFVTDFVEPGAKVITDGWQGYSGLEKLGYIHRPGSPLVARASGGEYDATINLLYRIRSERQHVVDNAIEQLRADRR
jgi:hypothetical protein